MRSPRFAYQRWSYAHLGIDAWAAVMGGSLGGMQAHIKFPMEELAQAIDAGFRRLPNPDRYEEVFSRAIAQAGDALLGRQEGFGR